MKEERLLRQHADGIGNSKAKNTLQKNYKQVSVKPLDIDTICGYR
jgi:hypothetical protein